MTERHYKISELSEEFGITARTLRHYEDYGLLTPSRKGNQRLYTYRDRVRLVLILRGKRIGFALSEIKEILDLYELPEGEQKQTSFLLEKIQQRRNALIQQKTDIDTMLHALQDIELKLTNNI
jgi:DNA-binding transcriptional MerR regulator